MKKTGCSGRAIPLPHCPAWSCTSQLVHDRYNMNQNIKLSEWSAISGFICALFTFCVPHLHHLRIYSGISVILIFIFSIIALAISIHDRASQRAPLLCSVIEIAMRSCVSTFLRLCVHDDQGSFETAKRCVRCFRRQCD